MPSASTAPQAQAHQQGRHGVDWAGIGWLYLFFWFFSGVHQILLIPSAGGVGLRNTILVSVIWLAPVLLFPRWTRQISAVLGLVLWAASLVSLGYLYIYGQEFSQSVIFIIFETNIAEAGEYLGQYFNLWLIVLLSLYSFIAFRLWRRVRPVYLPRSGAAGAAALLLLSNFGYPYLPSLWSDFSVDTGTRKLLRRMEPTVPWQLVIGYLKYQNQLTNVQKLLQNNAALPPLANLRDVSGELPRTLVLVIGESTTSRRMSLYGYPRPTTPHLDALQAAGSLSVFDNVITTRPYTIEILQQALTFANQRQPGRFPGEPTLMNLMKQAGYKTYWITNQQTMTRRNTLLTTFSQQADEAYYLNNNRSQNTRQYDEVVLTPFARVLQEDAPKKFIVVHLLGTHSQYALRYPDHFDHFTDHEQAPPELSAAQLETYNSYDNAVRYNDFVISRLIETFSAHQDNGFLLYFSDHGEEVFADPSHQVLGRNEGAPTRDMYAIPFILWRSPTWQATHPADFSPILSRKYSNAHLIHTWSDLSGLSYDSFQPELSLVNPAFANSTRWIGDPLAKNGLRDFDALFKPEPQPSPARLAAQAQPQM
ncbi:phosphoethanolamine transferase CptA [Betaproteobacteria bacterium]|nr:phosphoethanolamine transferase CptA [Betaproteobacteria bacterium]GHU16096.1 phosphoethanolamine transferase CptA [Betaproteobacteria bacterium]